MTTTDPVAVKKLKGKFERAAHGQLEMVVFSAVSLFLVELISESEIPTENKHAFVDDLAISMKNYITNAEEPPGVM